MKTTGIPECSSAGFLLALVVTATAGMANAAVLDEGFSDPAVVGTDFIELGQAARPAPPSKVRFEVVGDELFIAKHNVTSFDAVGTSATYTLAGDGSIAVRMRTAPFVDPLPASAIAPGGCRTVNPSNTGGCNYNGAFMFSMFFTDGFFPSGGTAAPGTTPDPGDRFEIGVRMRTFDLVENPIEVFGRGTGSSDTPVITTIGYDQEVILEIAVDGGDLVLSVYDTALNLLGQSTVLGSTAANSRFSFDDEPGARVVFSQNGKFDWVQAAYVDQVIVSDDVGAAATLATPAQPVPFPAAALAAVALLILGVASGALRHARRA